MDKRPQPLLWLDDHRGIYIPQHFAESFTDRSSTVTGVDSEDWKVLEAGPEHEHYWDTWDAVLRDAHITIDGVAYTAYQDGACWLIPIGMEYNEDTEFFKWPDEGDEDADTNS